MNWQREPPDEPGDWLWVEIERWGDCVSKSGICYVLPSDVGLCWILPNGLAVSWEGERPTFGKDGKPMKIIAWAKIDLPSQGFLEGKTGDFSKGERIDVQD